MEEDEDFFETYPSQKDDMSSAEDQDNRFPFPSEEDIEDLGEDEFL